MIWTSRISPFSIPRGRLHPNEKSNQSNKSTDIQKVHKCAIVNFTRGAAFEGHFVLTYITCVSGQIRCWIGLNWRRQWPQFVTLQSWLSSIFAQTWTEKSLLLESLGVSVVLFRYNWAMLQLFIRFTEKSWRRLMPTPCPQPKTTARYCSQR